MDCKQPEKHGDESMELGAAAVSSFGTMMYPGSAAELDSQLALAVFLKTEGNTLYREKKIRSAIGRYHRSLLILRSLDSDVAAAVRGLCPAGPVLTAGQEELLRNTQVDCYNNLSACLLLRQNVNYGRVQEYSLRVLKRRPGNVKAMYRAGVAFLEQGDAETARNFLNEASKGQPNDANVRRHLQRAEESLSREKEKEKAKEKALYRGMFSSQSNERNGVEDGAGGVTQK